MRYSYLRSTCTPTVSMQVQHLPMAGSQLFRRDLIDVRHGVAVMQHQHARAPDTMAAKPRERNA